MNKNRIFTMMMAWGLMALHAVADPISPARARRIASDFAGLASPNRGKGLSQYQLAEEENAPLYVFSRGAGKGYVLVSGSDCLPEVLGYTDSGDFDEATAPPALKALVEGYARMAMAAETEHRPSRRAREATGTKNIKPLLTTHWHQTWPYNNMCPKVPGRNDLCMTGCVATAASQILYYWRKDMPERTSYKTPTYAGWQGNADVTVSIPAGTPLKWDLMRDQYVGNEPKEYQDAVALLNYVIGTCDKMGYNASSGAYIWDLVEPFNKQFGLLSTDIYKKNYSQVNWEKRILKDLEKGYPMEYAGYHITEDGTWEGHAIVLDGYQMNGNLFHFNFGWGGQGDGYYTVEDDGVNGFGTEQSLVADIHPKKPHVEATFGKVEGPVCLKVPHRMTVRVTNHGTMPAKGFYLYCMSGLTRPNSNTSSAYLKAKDETTVVAPGETVELAFDYAPTSSKNFIMYLCNDQVGIYGESEQVEVHEAVGDLTLEQLKVDDGGTSETLVLDGQSVKVHHVYNTKKAYVKAVLRTASETPCTPAVKALYYPYDESSGTFSETAKSKTKSTVSFYPGSSSEILFDLSALTDGTIYRLTLDADATIGGKSTPIHLDAAEPVVYFRLMGADMQKTLSDDGSEVVLSGHYNAQIMGEHLTDPQVVRYDLTKVEGVKDEPFEAANPNALFYVSALQKVGGRNVVADGVCDDLDLTPGYNFMPKEDFVALRATYHAPQTDGQYSTVYLPFDCPVPDGLHAHRILGASTSSIAEADSFCLDIKGCTPYLILSASPVDLTAQHVNVSVNGASTGLASFKGTWANLVAEQNQRVLDKEETQYFGLSTGDPIPALTAYLEDSHKVRAYCTGTISLERKNKALACKLMEANAVCHDYKNACEPADMKALESLISESAMLLTHPWNTDTLTAAEAELQTRIDQLKRHAMLHNKDGVVDKTMYIVNPSFEATVASKGWTRTDSIGRTASVAVKGVKTTSSLTNYVSGADGIEVMQLNAGGYILSQQVEGLPWGTYQMKVSISTTLGEKVRVFAGNKRIEVEASDFGPYYLTDVVVDDVELCGDSLLIGVQSMGGITKVDNFRLYLKQLDPTGISAPAIGTLPVTIRGVYDLSGRKLNGYGKHGIYLVGRKKVIK